jgi:hypothetical protein
MSKELGKKCVTLASVALAGAVVLGHGLGGKVEAQSAPPTHQEILNQIGSLQSTVNGIVSSGVACKVRRYYQTTDGHQGDTALAACGTGFHMASQWEILDTSNLKYATELGFAFTDSGAGPPTRIGWTRTGGGTAGAEPIPGSAGFSNCFVWTSQDSADRGTAVILSLNWKIPSVVVSPWEAQSRGCNESLPVWCVED